VKNYPTTTTHCYFKSYDICYKSKETNYFITSSLHSIKKSVVMLNNAIEYHVIWPPPPLHRTESSRMLWCLYSHKPPPVYRWLQLATVDLSEHESTIRFCWGRFYHRSDFDDMRLFFSHDMVVVKALVRRRASIVIRKAILQ